GAEQLDPATACWCAVGTNHEEGNAIGDQLLDAEAMPTLSAYSGSTCASNSAINSLASGLEASSAVMDANFLQTCLSVRPLRSQSRGSALLLRHVIQIGKRRITDLTSLKS